MMKLKLTKRLGLLCAAIILLAISSGANSLDPAKNDPRNDAWDLNVDAAKVLGADSCNKCHAGETQTWKQTPHSETFLTLHRKKEAQEIASKLGIASFKSDSNCIQCHYTMQQQGPKVEAIAGVSCESCHGASKDWINVHNDYGGTGITRSSESPEHRRKRLSDSIAAGMRNPINVYLVAQSCYRCHTVPDEKLVNVGGHSAGSLDFELVSWSQGMIRHNFLASDGKQNTESSPERLRLMFVAGMIADLEFSLRATASATEKSTFGLTSAKRASRAADRLKSAQSKIQLPILDEVLKAYTSVTLTLNNRDPIKEAADQVHRLGLKFAATVRGEQLEAISAFIPPNSKWK
jgi:Cytochrome c554 and c-prime